MKMNKTRKNQGKNKAKILKQRQKGTKNGIKRAKSEKNQGRINKTRQKIKKINKSKQRNESNANNRKQRK